MKRQLKVLAITVLVILSIVAAVMSLLYAVINYPGELLLVLTSLVAGFGFYALYAHIDSIVR